MLDCHIIISLFMLFCVLFYNLNVPLSSNRQHLSYSGCLDSGGRRGILLELLRVVFCTKVVHSSMHKYEQFFSFCLVGVILVFVCF